MELSLSQALKPALLCLLTVLVLSFCAPLSAQHNIIYRDHHLHQVLVNPATAGSEYIPVAALSYQKQWLGINPSPFTLLASASLRMKGNLDFYNPRMMVNKSPFRYRERMGLGVGLYSDQNGPVASRGFSLAYAYHIALARSSLSLGLSANVEQSQIDGSTWNPINPDDPLLPAVKDSYYDFNANAGMYLSSRYYFAGLAINHLLPLDNKFENGEKVKQDFILHGGYMFWSGEDLSLEPAINLRYLDYETLEFDIRAKLYIQHKHWISVSYRSYNALRLAAGLLVESFYLAYNYELNLSSMINYSAGTHGVHLGWNLGMRGWKRF